MPTWGQVALELEREGRAFQQRLVAAGGQLAPGTPSPQDILRRKYLAELHALTGRAVIVYETAFLESRPIDPVIVQIHLGDVQGFMEACSNVTQTNLDLILHSPGGQAEATESIVKYLRNRFRHIRAIVPQAAMSAATMLALAADEIVMGEHSQLGPIDPQYNLQTPEGPRGAPGQAILDQFELAKEECKDATKLAAWLPILRMYGPGAIALIQHQQRLSKELVAGWLETYMFRRRANRAMLAATAAEWFGDFKTFKSHGRPVHLADARRLHLRVTALESDPALQDAVLSLHHAEQITLGTTPAAKIIENHHGRAFIKFSQMVGVPMQPLVMPTPTPVPTQPAPTPQGRSQRRNR
jgi:hypothetical protein